MTPCPDHLRGKVHRYHLLPESQAEADGLHWSLWLLDQSTASLCAFSSYGNCAIQSGRRGWVEPDFRAELLSHSDEYLGHEIARGSSSREAAQWFTQCLPRVRAAIQAEIDAEAAGGASC